MTMASVSYRNHDLWVEDIPLQAVVEKIKTPFYLYSHDSLIQQWKAFQEALNGHPHQICFAVKANSNLAVLNALAELGSGFDIVSVGELARVIAAKGDPKRVVFSGAGKQEDEIIEALKKNIYCFNVESEAELKLIHQIAKYLNLRAPIALRVNPNVDPLSHPYISTGLKESKFGVDIELAPSLYKIASKLHHLEIKGLACHIGSQLTSLSPFMDTFQRLIKLTHHLKSMGIVLNHLNVGGGLGVQYHEESPPTPSEYVKALLKHCNDSTTLLLEPGRAIAANAGILVTKVLYLKKAGEKNFCVVDCGMNDFARPMLYSSWHNIIPLQMTSTIPCTYDIVGPVCESGDFIAKDRLLRVKPGDYLVILSAGAYGFVMSSNYNSRPRVAEVMVKANQFQIVRKQETIHELFAKESIWAGE